MPFYSSIIENKIAALSAAGAIRQWRFKIAAYDAARPDGSASQPGFPDSDWETVTLNHTWSSLDGEGWFRATARPPAAVEGLSLDGSQVDLDIFLTTGATIYVNGEARFQEPSWSDTRPVPLRINAHYAPGEPIPLAVRCKSGDSFALFAYANLRFSRLEEAIFELDLLKAQLDFTAFLAGRSSFGNLGEVHQAAGSALDLQALSENRWEAWWTSAAAARAILQPFSEAAKSYTAHLVAHSHIDMNWLWPTHETVAVCQRDFSTMDHLMSVYPEFHFSQSQAAVYRFMETEHPAVFERIRQRAAEGRWEITANNWVEGDLNMASSEALVRQLLLARRYISSRFGFIPRVGWEPDTFGHPAAVPQLLAQTGIPYYYFCRAGHNHPLFWWEGPDGGRVLAVQDPRGYGSPVSPSGITASVIDFGGRYGIHQGLFVYGAGDHGGGATAEDIERARSIDAAPFLPHAIPGPASGFFAAALAEGPDLPVVRGELNTIFEGCYTSHGDIKRLNRQNENALLSAESALSAALLAGKAGNPAAGENLTQAWHELCFHQFHDILCGCAISVTYQEAHEKLEAVSQTAAQVAERAWQTIAAATDTRLELPGEDPAAGWRMVVFNPLAWSRTAVVRLPLTSLNGAPVPKALVDQAGRTLLTQVSGAELIFVAPELPPLGAAVFRPAASPVAQNSLQGQHASEENKGIPQPGVAYESNTLENGRLRLHVHPASGAIDQLVDLASGRDLAGPHGGWGPESKVNSGMLNSLQILWEQPHPMSAWNLGDITRVDHLITGAEVRVVETGPVRGLIEVRRKLLHSTLVQRIVLYCNLDRIDFENELDWHEHGSAHQDAPMLRVTFSPFLGQTRAVFETAFGATLRPADGREVPALRWADLSETEGDQPFGFSLLNDCKYGHQAHGNTLGLTLVRASYEPDVNPDEGLHRFTYSLYPHAGDWRQASTIQQSADLNQPVLAGITSAHPGSLPPGQPGLGASTPQVVISAVKPAEDQPQGQPAVIVRLYEAFGQDCQAALQIGWPVGQVDEVGLMEDDLVRQLPVVDGTVWLAFKPHEIKTLKLIPA